MPNNLLHTRATPCPACGHRDVTGEDAWEFAYGVLAGEVYELGDTVRFDEEFSFFDQRLGDSRGACWVEAFAVCEACAHTRQARVRIDDARLCELSEG